MVTRLLWSALCLVIYNYNSDVSNKVEARSHDVLPMRGGWFGSVETQGGQMIEVTEQNLNNNNEAFAEFSNLKRRKVKTKEKLVKKKEENIEKSEERVIKKKRKNKKRRKKNAGPKRFVKTTLTEKDRDSNMTDSMESSKKGKPVDIIVHIKMSE